MSEIKEIDYTEECEWCDGYGYMSSCCHTFYYNVANGAAKCFGCQKFTKVIKCEDCVGGRVLNELEFTKAKLKNFIDG